MCGPVMVITHIDSTFSIELFTNYIFSYNRGNSFCFLLVSYHHCAPPQNGHTAFFVIAAYIAFYIEYIHIFLDLFFQL